MKLEYLQRQIIILRKVIEDNRDGLLQLNRLYSELKKFEML